jgi:hypothetical protein
MPPSDPDDEVRGRTRGIFERPIVPGVPGLRLPPRPAPSPASDPERTPPEPYVAKRRAREQTRTDWPAVPPVAPRGQAVVATPVPGERRDSPPPRSLSPGPESDVAVDVRTPVGRLSVKKALLRHLWLWLAPAVLSALGFVGGAIKGYLLGLAMGHDEIVRVRTAQQIDHDALVKLATKEDADANAAAAEANSNRAERATAMRKLSDFAADLEAVKAAQPRIQGLAKPKP